ncbi:glycosyltransferase [Methylorubrum zatmanii]|uniref:Glycosyltransferase family 4 protein n=1 Tax=Methylorubrum zatmanii TaxID=29429 RepID=A0ABW1WTV0_9HYPH|nr:glycosyl transferase family 1 [Methylorubrum zatmanii]
MPMRQGPARPHILMSADALGGVWQYSLELARGLGRHGLSVTLALMGPAPSAGALTRAETETGARIVPTGLPLDWTARRPAEVVAAAAALARLAGDVGADLVHLHAPALALGAFEVPVVAVCHSCVATWWAALGDGPLPEDLAWRSELAARGCRAADRLLAPTRAFAEATRAAYGLPQPPQVVCNGRHCAETLPETAPVAHAFTAGRLWDPAKNATALDRMAARLDVPLFAAGPVEGPNGERCTPTHLRPLGRLDGAGMARELDRRPVFVSLARYEPFGLAVLEAAGAGCALVLSDIPTFSELWQDAAILIPADDEATAAQAAKGLLADPDKRARLAGAARARAARYGTEAMTAGVLGVFRDCLGADAAGAAA